MNRCHRQYEWQAPRSFQKRRLAPALRRWLLSTDSLTARLIRACDGGFRVEVLATGWRRPHKSEADALGLRPGQHAYVREVYLHCDEQRWVYARTVIPAASLHGRLRALTQLGNKPLGAVLFANPHMRRGHMQISRPRCQPYTGDAARVWGRRSVFYLYNRPLLVSEYFLDSLLHVIDRET